MEQDPLQTVAPDSRCHETNTINNLASINSCNIRSNHEPKLQNRHVSINTGSYLNSSGMRQHKTRNNPNNLRPILWFNSRNKIEKMCIAISCLIFLSSLIILLSLVAINKNKDFNEKSAMNQDDPKLPLNPQPVEISCPRAWYLLNGTMGNKASAGCYHFGSVPKTQRDSYRECHSRAGYLVEITSEVEHHYLSQKLQGIHSMQTSWDKWWIGLHLRNDDNDNHVDKNEGSGINTAIDVMDFPEHDVFPGDSNWIWKRSQVALSNQIYTGWFDGSTNRLEGNCVLSDHMSSWMWRTAKCSHKHYFICEIDGIRF